MKWSCSRGYFDVIIFRCSLEEHNKHITAFLARVAGANLQFKPQKCKLFGTELRYLGFIVLAEGVRADPAKTKALSEFPIPKSVTEVRRFLGFTGYFRRFVRNKASNGATDAAHAETLPLALG